MAADLQATLRTSAAYDFAHEAIEVMRKHGVWPTPLSFELCLHYIADPDGALARAIRNLIESGRLTTEDWSERLAREFLPRLRLQDQVSDAGEALTRELESVSDALNQTRSTTDHLDSMIGAADRSLTAARTLEDARVHVTALSEASQAVRASHAALERRLAESSAEMIQLREHMDRIRREAMTDPLTMLSNRRAFDQQLPRACAEADAADGSLTLAMIDIDYFKRFNDTWGHQIGDQVLRYVGRLLAAVGSPPRIAARYGGEEFALLLPREGLRTAFSAMEALRDDVSGRALKRRGTGDDLGSITISIGIAERCPGEDPASLVRRADEALYASKRAGRNRTSAARPPAADCSQAA